MNSNRPDKQHIHHLAKYYFPNVGGMETATKELAEAAVDLGFAVSCNASIDSRTKQEKKFVHNGVFVKASSSVVKLFSAPIGLGPLLYRIHKNSIVHIHMPNPIAELRVLVSLLLSAKRKKNIVPFLHALPVGQGILGKFWFNLVTISILKRVETVFISDPFFFDTFPILNRWKDKFVVMPFCSDPISQEEFESLLSSRVSSKTVLAVGRLVPYKGYDILIRAWHKLKQLPGFADHQLKIIGEGAQKKSLQNLAEELGVAESIYFLGSVSDEAKWNEMKQASLFVAPSLTVAETFGISILEAMSSGLPVIASDLKTGVSSLARAGDCGDVVPAGDVSALAESMAKLLRNIENSVAIAGRENLEFVKASYTREILLDRYRVFVENHLARDS